ncbi:unnamed protein product [Toxocara canis]|uniref:Uncharacterized protein n=1 Tax=Toxocara canis TaxID=6265 RepID=A0A183UGL0_TOXCA|nr:unnamed protein product [Toxocara canis]
MGGVGTIWRGDEGNVPKQSDGNYQNTDRNIHGIGETWDALREKYVERDSVRDNRSSSTHCFNNEVGLAMPVKHTYRPLTVSDVGQQTRVSFATIPILCGHPDDRFVEHADSSIKRHFKPTSEHQPTPGRRMPISDSLGKGRPLNDHSTVSMQPNNLSSNSTSSEANCISLTESNTPFMMQTDSLSATPASALNTIRMKRDTFEYKVSAIPRRLIDFSRAGELASSTPQKHTDKIRSDEAVLQFTTSHWTTMKLYLQLRHGANWSVVQAACPLESLDSGDGNKTNLSIQKHPTHSCAFRYHEQPIEHRANAANDIHRTRFGEEIVTQSPEVKKQATDVLNSILQQRVTNSPGLFNRSGTSLYSPCGRCAENHASVLGCGGYCTYRQKSAELGQRREKALAPKVSEVVGNIERSETSALSSKRPPTKSAEWEGCGNEREVIGHTTSLMPSGHSTIRARVPRGQTRRLASMFETMTEEAIAEMTSERSRLQANVSHRRNKSVPAQRGTHEGYAQRDPSASLLKGSLDDSFLMERECDNQEGKRYISRAIFRLSSSNVGSTKDNLVHIHNPKPIFSETQCMMAPINRGTNSMDNRQLPSATVPRIESTTQCFSTSLKGTHHSVGRHEMTGEAGRKPTEAGGYAGLAQKKAYFYANNGQQLQSGERKPGRNYGMECLRVGDELDNNDEHARIHANIVHSGTVPPFQSDCNNESHRKVSEHGSDDWCAGYMATDAIERSYDAADNIAEVNKAFSFVDKEESMVDDTDARYSRGGAAVHPVPKQPLGYSVLIVNVPFHNACFNN